MKTGFARGNLFGRVKRIEDLELIASECICPPLTFRNIDDIYEGFVKALDNIDRLKYLENEDTLQMPTDSAARRKMFRK